MLELVFARQVLVWHPRDGDAERARADGSRRLPDRDERLRFLLGLLPEPANGSLRVIDLACGPGSLTDRCLALRPEASFVAVDLDPVLLAIYRALIDGPADTVIEADLRDPGWHHGVPDPGAFDAVITATALHWVAADNLRRLYRELHHLLRPGGIFLNADHMPISDSPTLASACEKAMGLERSRLRADWDAWRSWWESVSTDPTLGPLLLERERRFANRSEDFMPSAECHLDALADAGFSEAAVVWRRGNDAIVTAAK